MNTFFFDDVQYPEGLFGGKDFFNPIIYSTEEREVGVWIDNKPLYQRTYQTTELFVDNSGADISSYIDNQAEIENYINAYAVNTANAKQSANVYIGIGSGNRILVFCAEVGTFNCFTVWYTKTTDVAGSGSYNTLGVPNVHYSTDEQVIGTWIDGKPIYQKSYQLAEPLSVRTNAWVSVTGIELQNVDTPINCIVSDGIAVQSWVCVDFKDMPISIAHSRNAAITVQNFTFQYTKTTD